MLRIKYKEAVGLEAKKGKPAIGKRPEKAELKKLYVKESRSIRKIAETLGCSKDMVYRSLKEYGIVLRPHSKESKLSKYSIKELQDIVAREGIRGGRSEAYFLLSLMIIGTYPIIRGNYLFIDTSIINTYACYI